MAEQEDCAQALSGLGMLLSKVVLVGLVIAECLKRLAREIVKGRRRKRPKGRAAPRNEHRKKGRGGPPEAPTMEHRKS